MRERFGFFDASVNGTYVGLHHRLGRGGGGYSCPVYMYNTLQTPRSGKADSTKTVFTREQRAQFEWSFRWLYFGMCVRKITSRCVIWIVQFKWRSGGIFQWGISQITQRNMNALTSKCDLGGGAMWPRTTSAYIPRAAYLQKHRNRELRACLIGRVPRHEPRKFGLPCVHCVIQISQLLLSCAHCLIQIAQFEWSFKLRTLLSCENSPSHPSVCWASAPSVVQVWKWPVYQIICNFLKSISPAAGRMALARMLAVKQISGNLLLKVLIALYMLHVGDYSNLI